MKLVVNVLSDSSKLEKKIISLQAFLQESYVFIFSFTYLSITQSYIYFQPEGELQKTVERQRDVVEQECDVYISVVEM